MTVQPQQHSRSGRPFGADLVWAPPRSLATTRGIALFSSPYLDVSVRAVPSHVPMDSARGATPCRVAGCPIRRSSAQRLVPAPRRLSQLPTSFFGTRRQGIHRMLVLPSSSVPRLTKPSLLIVWLRCHAPSPCDRPHSAQVQSHSTAWLLLLHSTKHPTRTRRCRRCLSSHSFEDSS